MPNYKGPKLDDIKYSSFLDGYIADAERNFPIDLPTVQAMLVPPDTLDLIDELVNQRDIRTIDTHNELYFWVNHPDIPRSPQIQVVNCKFYLKDGSHRYPYHSHSQGIKRRSTSVAVADLSQLSEDQLAKLIEWVNNVVTARRTVNLAKIKIKSYLKETEPSLWHIMTQWPTLKLLFSQDLKKLASEGPRYPHHYGWGSSALSTKWAAENQRFLPVIDSVLLKCSILPRPPEDNRKTPRVSVWNWLQIGDEWA